MKSRRGTLASAMTAFLLAPVLGVGLHDAHPQGVCSITVRNDVHLAPAAELATTKGYPDIVILENALIQVSSIPNRGRLIFDYVYKPTGHSTFYTHTSPMPLQTDTGYFLEFGGYYVSHPWNPRSNQPYDLEYEVVKESTEECTIKIFKDSPDLEVALESLITIKKDDPSVYVETTVNNGTNSVVTVDFFDRSVIALGDEMSGRTRVVLPRGIDSVTLGENADGWMGRAGETVPWPQPWQKWGEFKGRGEFAVDLGTAKESTITVHDAEQGIAFSKEWNPGSPYQRIEFFSWGPGYADHFGAYRGFAVTNLSNRLSISPGEPKIFRLQFNVSAGD